MTVIGPKNFPTFNLYSTGSPSFIKQQWVRMIDILILGPFALWLGYQLQKDSNRSWGIIPYLLYAYAFGTIVYNYSNLIAQL